MAPMTTWSANDDGTISDEELSYYRRRSGGVGLVITGCAHVSPNGIGFHNEFSADDDAFIPSLKRLAAAIKSGGAKSVLQIFHAGNKAVPELIKDGDVVSASAFKARPGPFNSGETISRALNQTEIEDIIVAFGQATRRAIEAGFDGVEIHGAHGFLLQNFLSPLYNHRNDNWGGNVENRLSFPMAVLKEINRVIKAHADRPFMVGYRFSPEESEAGALRIEDTLKLVDELYKIGIDYFHASLKDVLNATLLDNNSHQLAVDRITAHLNGRVPFIAAGKIETPEQAAQALKKGVSIAAIGRRLVMNPDWAENAYKKEAEALAFDLAISDIKLKSIPNKLWDIIASTPGWFPIKFVEHTAQQ